MARRGGIILSVLAVLSPAGIVFADPHDDATTPSVVFMGDSITQFWGREPMFTDHPNYVDVGVAGQTACQMATRFDRDVIARKPAVVHILGGTNDVAQNAGPESDDTILSCLLTMVDKARSAGIRVVLGSIPPTAAFPWRKSVAPVAIIRRLNARLRAEAERRGIVFVDYYDALADKRHGMRAGLTADGVHPLPAGYAIMAPLGAEAIAHALRQAP